MKINGTKTKLTNKKKIAKMGELAEILRDNLRELAHSHSRTLRGIDVELNAAKGQRFILVIKLKMIF